MQARSVLTQSSGHHWQGRTQDQDGYAATNDLQIRTHQTSDLLACTVQFLNGGNLQNVMCPHIRTHHLMLNWFYILYN